MCGQPRILVPHHHTKLPHPLGFCWLCRPPLVPVMAHELVDSSTEPPPTSQHWLLPFATWCSFSPVFSLVQTPDSPELAAGSPCPTRAVLQQAAGSKCDSHAMWKPWGYSGALSLRDSLCLPSLTTRFTLTRLPSFWYKTTLEAASSQNSSGELGENCTSTSCLQCTH